jgi:hypothetical protein
MDKTVYRLINRSGNQVMTFSKAQDVATYMLGRQVDNYIIVKTTHLVCGRVVAFDEDYYYDALVLAMENA